MGYDVFKRKVNALINRAGGDISVLFLPDVEGKHYARCSDGTVITGNTSSLKVTVRWGSGHQSVVSM